MSLDNTERRLIRAVLIATIVFCLYAVARNAWVVYDDISRSVPAYWCAIVFVISSSSLALVLSWRDIQKALLVFGWAGLLCVTTMAIYDACYLDSAEWNSLAYFPPVVGVGLMTFFVAGKPATFYGIGVSISAILEGLAYCDSIHAVTAIGLAWIAWGVMWIINRRFGRLETRIVELEKENREVKGATKILKEFIESEAQSEL